ncbi:Single myb histone 5 [Camellia lanceoleosa]|uniref:Single myb histone 5 n=1 Tax=Camellia lanceoleosa TaxID=1840588 RepID=A0ACC0F4K3_9ERIC|nr:Single myb histone 5 [Camellia lanceoleosa]
MDIDVARWVLDFILRQSVDDRLLNALIRVLPLPNDNSSLKKAMLLRRIESEIAKCLVSEKILELLERIEELDCEEGVEASKAMKGAYCAVAVDCVVRFLDESEDKEAKYFDAVKRIWRGRVWKMERSEKAVGLVSDELRSWKDEIEAVVWDASVCENVRMRNRGNDALEAVRTYVAEVWEIMGPSFLDLVAETVSDVKMKEVLGLGNNQVCNGVGEIAACTPDSRHDLIAGKGNNEMQRGIVLPRRKHVAVKRGRVSSGTSRGVKIADSDDLDIGKSSNNYGCLPTPEINKVQEALRTSRLELHAAVKDPLPDALQVAENVISSMRREDMNQEPSVEGHKVDVEISIHSVDRSAEAAQANEANLGNQCFRHQNNVPKPSLMARNSTAHTCEWDDPIDSLSEGSPGRGSIHLPTPKRRLVSPLKKYEIKKIGMRRKHKKWSTLEEDTLRTGVQKYGIGNWKLILDSYRDIFEQRTEVDLKDKWRNMIRY